MSVFYMRNRGAWFDWTPPTPRTTRTWATDMACAEAVGRVHLAPWREESLLEYPLNPPGWIPSVRDGILAEPWSVNQGSLTLPTRPGLGFEIDRRALRRFGRRFFRGTKLRVAISAVLDTGLRVAKEAGAARDARLADRRREIEGRDMAAESLEDPSPSVGNDTLWTTATT